MKRESKNKRIYGFTLVDMIFIILVFAILAIITHYSIKLITIRSRDTQRIAEISDLKATIDQKFSITKTYPASGYDNLGDNLAIFSRDLPQDPINEGVYKYSYIATDNAFVLYARVESINSSAMKDKGKYNSKPLYYEVGSGKNWKSLVPNNLK